jgi:tetratricopeptide (TPR) repeat protein
LSEHDNDGEHVADPSPKPPGEDLGALRAKAEGLAQEGRLPEAAEAFRAVVRRAKDSFGKQSPGHGAALYDLARVLSAQGKHAEAEDLLRRALAIFEVSPGVAQPPYAHALHSLSGVLGALDRFADAEKILREALAKQEGALGPDHASLGPTLTNLAIALVQTQQLEEAEKVVTRSLAIAEEAYGEAHEETARILTVLAQVQAARGAHEAPATARRALNALIAIHGADHALVSELRPMLEDICEPSNELDIQLQEGAAALEARDAARAIEVLTPLVARAERDGILALEASAAGMLSQALFVTGKTDEALKLARRAVAIAEDAGQDDAAAHFRQVLEAMERGSAAGGLPDGLNRIVETAIDQAHRGDIAGAQATLATAADEAQSSGDMGAEATMRIVLGQILREAKDPAGAERHLRRALAIAEQVGDAGAADHVQGLLASLQAPAAKPS